MNAKLIALTLAAAVLASPVAHAGQAGGRDSVYTTAASVFPSAKAERSVAGNGRGSVYAADLPAATPRATSVGEVKARLGRT